MRAWHPQVVPYLDDERLTANHSEAHMMANALERGLRGDEGRIGWWSHPETACFVKHPEFLAWLHDFTVLEMKRRGYPSGSDHKTPIQFFRPQLVEWEDPGFNYKRTAQEWLERDLADLYVKWEGEDRWDGGNLAVPRLGRRVSCPDSEHCYKGHRTRHWPQQHTWHMSWSRPDTVSRTLLRQYHDKVGPREDIHYDREAMRQLLLAAHGSRKSEYASASSSAPAGASDRQPASSYAGDGPGAARAGDRPEPSVDSAGVLQETSRGSSGP